MTAALPAFRPPRPARGVIERPRLDGLLELVRGRLLTRLLAPPGYGKTTVALSWAATLAGDGVRVAWLRLGPDDGEVERFLGALAAALREACRGSGDDDGTDPGWTPGDLSIPREHRLAWLVERVAACGGEVALFIDDAHELVDQAALRVLSSLLRSAPDNFHLVLLARTELPLALVSLRAHDAVLDLRADTLCFDLVETEQLLRKTRPDSAPATEAAQLHAYTGGWIAALRAALLTLRLQGASAAPGRRLALRPVQALFAELLEQLPAADVAFLESVATTERLCAPLAERLSGRTDAQRLLQRLEAQQLFITALDDEAGWFEFHRLFRDHLQRQAQARDPAGQQALHRAAAGWFAETGAWTEAIHHALAGGDIAQALAWIEQHAMALVGRGDLLTLLAWERRLRAHLVQSPRRLRLAFAWGLSLAMACDRALALLDGVEAEFGGAAAAAGLAVDGHAVDGHPGGGDAPDAAAAAALHDECCALRAVLVSTTGDYELSAALAGRCGSGPQPPWVANAVRNVIAAVHLHTGRWQHLHAAAPVLDRADGPRPADPMALDYRLSIRGLAEYRQGHLDEAAALLEEAMSVGAACGPQGQVLAALPAPTLALVRYAQGRLADAARINATHFDVNRRVAPMEGLYGAYQVAARLARLDGQPVRARHLLDEGEAIAVGRGWRRAVVVLRLERLRHCLLDGRLAEAAASAEGIAAMAQPAPGRPALECRDFGHAAALARAWCDLVAGDAGRAAALLQAECTAAAATGRRLDEIGIGTTLALAQLAGGERGAALATFAAISERAGRLGALRTQLDQPLPLAPLLDAWAAGGAAQAVAPELTAWVARLQAALPDAGPRRAPPAPAAALSPREHHILKLMAAGQSNKAIARSLGIAPETVKTHVSKIFTKLGASNRAQAVAMVAGG